MITPHQISTEANQLARSGIKGKEFLDEISNKNYYSESKQIPQVVDGEIYLTKATINRKWHLFIGRGKHRGLNILDDEFKQTVLAFPRNAPILEDINETDDLIQDDSKLSENNDDVFGGL